MITARVVHALADLLIDDIKLSSAIWTGDHHRRTMFLVLLYSLLARPRISTFVTGADLTFSALLLLLHR
jgi:hypothetical protein